MHCGAAGVSLKRASGFGVAAILLWSAFALLASLCRGIPPFQMLAVSFAVAGVFGVLIRPAGIGPLAVLRQPLASWLLASLALAGYHSLYFFALATAPVVEASLINYLWPLLIVVFAALLPGQVVRPGQWLGALLGLAGAALVVTRGEQLALDPRYLSGYLAALAAALVWAAYSVLNRRFVAVPSHAIAGPCLLTALVGLGLHGLLEHWVAPSLLQWSMLLALGMGPVGIAFRWWDRGCKQGDIALLGSLSYLAPVLSTGWLLLAGLAQPHWTQGAALALLLLGAGLALRSGRRAAQAAVDLY